MKLNIEFDDITVEQAEVIEEYSGMSLDDFFKEMGKYSEAEKNPPMKMLTPIVWIAGCQDDPNFTIEQARKVKFSELGGPEPEGNAPAAGRNGTAPRKRNPRAVKASTAS